MSHPPAGMTGQPATPADIPAIAELQRRWDVAWFGAPEHDDDEVAEDFSMIDDPQRHSLLIRDGERLVAAALRHRTDTSVIIDPEADATPLYDELLRWLLTADVEQVDVLDRDTGLQTALEAAGWTYRYSAFDLLASFDGWAPPEPSWAPGVTVRDYRPDDAPALHRMVYDEAHFATIPGHFRRDLGEWLQLFVDGRTEGEMPILACRGDRIVGAAIGRGFADGTAWINQLAVAESERGTGIGTALMAAYFLRRRAAGATQAGLAVMADNRAALRLYLAFGLAIDREFRFYAPPAS